MYTPLLYQIFLRGYLVRLWAKGLDVYSGSEGNNRLRDSDFETFFREVLELTSGRAGCFWGGGYFSTAKGGGPWFFTYMGRGLFLTHIEGAGNAREQHWRRGCISPYTARAFNTLCMVHTACDANVVFTQTNYTITFFVEVPIELGSSVDI